MASGQRIITVLTSSAAISAVLDALTQLLMHLPHPPLLLFAFKRVHITLHAHHLTQIVRQSRASSFHSPLNIGPEMRRQLLHPLASEPFLLRSGRGGIVAPGELVEVPSILLLLLDSQAGGLDDRDVEVWHSVCLCEGSGLLFFLPFF